MFIKAFCLCFPKDLFGPCEVIVKALNVALAGCGTVGGGVAEILLNRAENYQSRTGPILNLAAIADIQIAACIVSFTRFPEGC